MSDLLRRIAQMDYTKLPRSPERMQAYYDAARRAPTKYESDKLECTAFLKNWQDGESAAKIMYKKDHEVIFDSAGLQTVLYSGKTDEDIGSLADSYFGTRSDRTGGYNRFVSSYHNKSPEYDDTPEVIYRILREVSSESSLCKLVAAYFVYYENFGIEWTEEQLDYWKPEFMRFDAIDEAVKTDSAICTLLEIDYNDFREVNFKLRSALYSIAQICDVAKDMEPDERGRIVRKRKPKKK